MQLRQNMKSLFVICSLIFLIFFLRETKADEDENENNGVYIVYMGAAPTSRNNHSMLLTSLETRKRHAVVQNYQNNFLGFAARLTESEAQDIAREPGVISVFPDPVYELHTTRSWDFLKYQMGVETDSRPRATYNTSSRSYDANSDIIIGVMDTGIWPESESFDDDGFGPIPSKWKGDCMQSEVFANVKCNRKVIGAKYYNARGDFSSPRDMNGHGTHVASTAAGNAVSNASYYGLAMGSAKGGFPGSRIAMYRVCGIRGCLGSVILAAFDDAIKDGVDILSLSLGAKPGFGPNFHKDPIAIGAFHATENGIVVVCSAGNDGPRRSSVVNVAPWVLTVAASSIDRDFQADIILGDKTVIKGGGINFGNIQKSPVYPLLYGESAKRNSSVYDEKAARNCLPRSLDRNKLQGAIVLCENRDGIYTTKEKLAGVKRLGATGMIYISNEARSVASSSGSFPMATVSRRDGSKIIAYVNKERNPTVTIKRTVSVTEYKPAPVIAYFSARGPSYATKDIIKPDIAAPGVAILASWPDNAKARLRGKNPPHFYIISGTSMSCPHVSGIAAMIKSQNPNWTPSTIRSAIMTTASQTNNMKKPITTTTGVVATPYDFGAGQVASSPLQPGLVYDTEIKEYMVFLCHIGYNVTTIKRISSTVPPDFSCPATKPHDNSVSNMNYPSIAVSNFNGKESKVIRTVTNVDGDETTYTVSVEAPNGLEVKVTPNKLEFTESKKKQTYEVIFMANGKVHKDNFGSITWLNGKYRVRSPFVVSRGKY